MTKATITSFPVGNGDSTLIELIDDRLLLIDYCHRRNAEDEEDKRIDLAKALREKLEERNRDAFDAVTFTHADDDHVALAHEFFWLDHAKKYQGDDRPRIEELWVPAGLILEPSLKNAALALRQEARYRLKNDYGIRVFSAPGALDEWLKKEGINPADRAHCISHAGTLVPGYSFNSGGVKIFVHSPFSYRFDEDPSDRNNGSVVLHFTFKVKSQITRFMSGADAEHEAWRDLVLKTERKGRLEYLRWDLFNVSHHCSWTALGPPHDKSAPIEEVKRLFEKHGQKGGRIVSSSNPIDSPNPPPHKEAADYYKGVVDEGNFHVTMEHPSKKNPEPIVIDITDCGLDKNESELAAGAAILASPSPRFGSK